MNIPDLGQGVLLRANNPPIAAARRVSKHIQVEDRIKALIDSQRLLSGAKLPDEIKMAKGLGVSRVTLRRALATLADSGLLVREKGSGTFVSRVPDAYEDLNQPFYCTVEGNDPFVFPNLDHVGIIVPFTYEAYATGHYGYIMFEIINGLRDELAARKIALNVITLTKDASIEDLCRKAAQARQLQGLIYHGSADLMEEDFTVAASRHIGRGIPWLILSKRFLPPNAKRSVVCCHDEPGGALMVEHLKKLGHQRIACIYFEDEMNKTDSRARGWFTGMRNAGLPVDEKLIVKIKETGQKAGYAAMQKILALPRSQRPTAVCLMSDPWAIGALVALKERGLRVPGDMAVVGFDDMPLARHSDPPLTTVKKDRYRLGQEAARMLLALNSRGGKASLHKVLAPTLVVRESTMPRWMKT